MGVDPQFSILEFSHPYFEKSDNLRYKLVYRVELNGFAYLNNLKLVYTANPSTADGSTDTHTVSVKYHPRVFSANQKDVFIMELGDVLRKHDPHLRIVSCGNNIYEITRVMRRLRKIR